MTRHILIAGTRGIPNSHGGFESFAEHLALHLTEIGWNVTVVCQNDKSWRTGETRWKGVRLLHLPSFLPGPTGSLIFDLLTAIHAVVSRPTVLTLGYNSAVLFVFYRLFNIINVVNMDGIEWRRAKWSRLFKAWFYLNEHLAIWLADALIADHPVIADRLRRKIGSSKPIATIPYGAHPVREPHIAALQAYGLKPGSYALVVARPEPENSILEIIEGFCASDLPLQLVVLGKYRPKTNSYHHQVQQAADDRVRFLGAIYDRTVVEALRSQAWIYVHGHQVGGTNPSLVEALAARCAVLAHDNAYNRWVAGDDMAFFDSTTSCARSFRALYNDQARLNRMRQSAQQRFEQAFRLEPMYACYRDVLERAAQPLLSPSARTPWSTVRAETGQTKPRRQ